MNVIQTNQLKKIYDNGVEALKGLDLTVPEGEIFGLLGPNGAGKSTTIGILTSLVRKTSGTAKVFGMSIDEKINEIKLQIGLVPQEFNFNIFESVEDILFNQAGYYGLTRKMARLNVHKYLQELELWDKRHVQSRELSGGMKRRLLIARALIHQPKLLILDEPTANVDLEIRYTILDFIKEYHSQKNTIIFTSHNLEEMENLCDHVGFINKGVLVKQARVDELIASLHSETYVLNTKTPLDGNTLKLPFSTHIVSDYVLEIDLPKPCEFNDLFQALTKENIVVTSMKNKRNRLEHLYLSIINESN